MAFLKIENVVIRGISACVPSKVEENKDLPFYGPGEAEQVMEATGIERRHVSTPDVAVSDLCIKAAEKLISELGWEKESIDLVGLATQCPDYLNQPTSFVVHEKLGMPESTMCIDFFHGCPAWVVGLSSIMSMLSSGCIKRAILLDGDIVSRSQRKLDRESRPLFGDCGTATALEYCESCQDTFFNIGTKSEDGLAIADPLGGYRNPYTVESLKRKRDQEVGLYLDNENTSHMDSMDVFSFAITKVPKAIKKLCTEYNIDIEDIDNLVLHQANKMIVETIAKRLKLPIEKVPMSLKNYGNTTSASIPLTIVAECAEIYRNNKQKTIVCGFGTGLSWGAICFETEKLIIPEVIHY